MAGLIFDAGALIAGERDDRRVYVALKSTLEKEVPVLVPAPVVAQVYRDARQVKLLRLLASCRVEPLTERRARIAGTLCGMTETNDVVDASVAALGSELRADILTADVDDIRALVNAAESRVRVLEI